MASLGLEVVVVVAVVVEDQAALEVVEVVAWPPPHRVT